MTDKPQQYFGPRYQLAGPKAQVIKVERGVLGMKIHLRVYTEPHPVEMIWDVPTPNADVRAMVDWLTLTIGKDEGLRLFTEIAIGKKH